MASFKDREKGFEAKYKNDEETRFKVESRRNRMLGAWAAELLGKADADAYIKEVMASDFDEPGDDDVLRKVLGDFEAAKVAMTREALRRKMDDLYAEAHLQVTQG
tara:strand:+ start:78651 stop:78965 length:315 start_codon:yes stop_codon:yes gene_type:complete